MNDMISRFNTYPLGQKVLVMLLFIILMVIGFYFLYYQPYEEEVAQLNAELKQLQEKREEFEVLKNERAEVLSRLEKLKRELLVAREQLPADAEVPSLLQRIHNQAKTAGLEITRFKRVEDVNKNYYTEIPVEMKLSGSFDELANFFYYLGRMTRIVNVREITMKQQGGATKIDAEEAGELEVTAKATTFMYNAPDATAQAAAPAGRRQPPGKR